MINKANYWTSNDLRKLEKVSVYYRIKNLSKNTTLGVTENGIVIDQPLDEDEKGQLWEKEPIKKGWFTLTSFRGEGKLLTSETTTSDSQLVIRGMNLMSFTDLSEGCVSLLKRFTINHIF